MLRERTPVAGITIAVFVLLFEWVVLIGYHRWEQHVADEEATARRAAAQAIRESDRTKAKFDEIFRELHRLEIQIQRLDWALRDCEDPDCGPGTKRRLQDRRLELIDMMQRAHQLKDTLIVRERTRRTCVCALPDGI